MTVAEANLLRAQLMIEELRRRGTGHVVICPGSRSSPLAIAVAMDKRIRSVVHYDERGAGFFAVGYARATGKPAPVITTSGTAAANLLPAIVEASMDNLPLLAITADRPPELHGCGANQTIDQSQLYGNHIRAQALLPCPDDPVGAISVLSAVSDVYARALRSSSSPGPAHLNCPFREPLVPPAGDIRSLDETISEHQPELTDWYCSVKPYGGEPAPTRPLEPTVLKSTIEIIRQTNRGLLIIGYLRTDHERRTALELSRNLNWPTLADITSGLSGIPEPHMVRHYDLILASVDFADSHAPDTVLHIGGRFTSKRLLQFIERSQPAHYIFNAGHDVIFDPVRAVTLRTGHETSVFCRSLGEHTGQSSANTPWLDGWSRAGSEAARTVAQGCSEDQPLTEPSLARALSERLGTDAALFLASSLPIRDMDMFASLRGTVSVAANRGASGIDGTIASACGYAAGLGQPVVLLIGDQSCLHDLNSLALVRQSRQPLVIVVINNNGGRIFELLPIAEHRELLDRFFVAPHGFTIGRIAEMFGLQYESVRTLGKFRKTLDRAGRSQQSTIIEVMVDPAHGLEHRSQLLQAVQAAVETD
ncbi:MAG: 2-succinyl-5-enolpyruvyl-6-hydroxy-3-cyclohexene-1-carboxylic-acid synthase [Candidatus Zixiibacteriota bacterium]